MAMANNSKSARIRVAICGGGIGGLTLAVVLGKFSNDVQIDLYESAPKFTEIGAGISVWKRTWSIMQLLGLDSSLGKMAVKPPVDELSPGFIFRKGDQDGDGGNFHQMIVPYGSITLHRADMLAVLMENLPPVTRFRAHFSKRLISYHQLGPEVVALLFSDGTDAFADILIGADGIRSNTRATMYKRMADAAQGIDPAIAEKYKDFIQPSWSGTYAYRALVEPSRLLEASPGHQAASTPLIYFGKNKHIVSYPISQGRLINLIPFVTIPGGEGTKHDGPAFMDVSKQEMIEHFVGWEPEVQKLLDCVEKPSRWAISHVRGLPKYVDGRVALLGDSAHAMTTHIGAGAGQAIEDAYILGRLLANPSVSSTDLPAILKVYEAVRLPFANAVVERSRSTGFYYEFNDLPGYIDAKKVGEGSREELKKLAEEVYKKWELQWMTMPEEEWRQAENMLQKLSGARANARL